VAAVLLEKKTRASNAVGMARLLPGMLREPEHAVQPLRKR